MCLVELPRAVPLAQDPPATSTYHLGILSLPLEEYSWQDDIASELLESIAGGRECLTEAVRQMSRPSATSVADLEADDDDVTSGKCSHVADRHLR